MNPALARGLISTVIGVSFALSASVAFASDALGPSVIAVAANASTASAEAAQGSCLTDGVEVTVVFSLGASTASPAIQPTCTGGSWSVTTDVSGIPDGLMTLKATQNGHFNTLPVLKDILAPAVQAFVDDGTFDLSGPDPVSNFDGTFSVDPEGHTFALSDTVAFNFNGDSDITTMLCSVDSGATTDCASFSYIPTSVTAGSHVLHVVAHDQADNVTSVSKNFCVDACGGADTTPPVISQNATSTVEATSAAGATVTYTTPTATDTVDGSDAVACLPTSGSIFAIGTTTVSCTSHDVAGNYATSTFGIIVQDTTKPVIAAAPDVFATSTATSAIITYTNPAATDSVDGSVSVICAPASGSPFSLGNTVVTCNASDAASNAATPVTFTVHNSGDVALATPGSGSYTSAQSVTLEQSGATSIHYTADGSTPTCTTGTVYSGPVTVSSSLTIQAIACYSDIGSIIASYLYDIHIPAPTPTPSVVGSNGPPVANPVSPTVSSGTGTGTGGGGTGTGAIADSTPAPSGTANGTPIVAEVPESVPVSTPVSHVVASQKVSTTAAPSEVAPQSNSDTTSVVGLSTPESDVQPAAATQVASVTQGFPWKNDLWILFVLLALLLGGWFVWNTFWTRNS